MVKIFDDDDDTITFLLVARLVDVRGPSMGSQRPRAANKMPM
jgi:hypothetical protein